MLYLIIVHVMQDSCKYLDQHSTILLLRRNLQTVAIFTLYARFNRKLLQLMDFDHALFNSV